MDFNMNAITPSSGPVPTGRNQTIDILRGMALVLILIVHCSFDFTGWDWTIPEEHVPELPMAALNPTVGGLVDFFLRDKARALFALMFGVSFALQLARSEQSGRSFERMFIKRMVLLAMIGLVHGHLIYYFEILRLYAMAGLLMLLLWRLPNKALLPLVGFLTVLAPIVGYGLLQALGLDFMAGRPPQSEIFVAFTSDSPREILSINHRLATSTYLPGFLIGFGMPILGNFLLGLWLARKGWLQDPMVHRKALKRLMVVGLVFGLLLQSSSLIMPQLDPASPVWLFLLLGIAFLAAAPMLMLGYVGTITLLCTHPLWIRVLRWLAPAGRMTLTHYIMQSVFAWVIFYGVGLGLYGRIGPALAVPIGLLLATFQVLLSIWWLKRYRSGPLEWLWRWAIEGLRPQWRRESHSAP
ncbi:DUF418 domain-containing protein [Cecembia lonarensis]|nr:DUF418 domain-containing protein [Cecembia lonarensis]